MLCCWKQRPRMGYVQLTVRRENLSEARRKTRLTTSRQSLGAKHWKQICTSQIIVQHESCWALPFYQFSWCTAHLVCGFQSEGSVLNTIYKMTTDRAWDQCTFRHSCNAHTALLGVFLFHDSKVALTLKYQTAAAGSRQKELNTHIHAQHVHSQQQ